VRIILTTQGVLPLNGGLAQSVPLLANALAGQGADVHLVAPGYGAGASTMNLPSPPVQSHILRQRILRLFPSAWQGRFLTALWWFSFKRIMGRLLAAGDAVVIHDNGIWLPTNHWAAVCAGQSPVPLVTSPRGMLSQWATQHRSWRKRLAWSCYARRDLNAARVIHATSLAEAEDVRRLGLKQPIVIIPNGVELQPLMDRPATESSAKTLLFLSRINPVKGLTMLADAWASLRPSGWRIVVAGFNEDGYLQKIEQHVRKLGVESSFEFSGPVMGEAKWRLFRSADAFVLPSHSESFGISIAEALSFGLPVITTRATPWPEIEIRSCGWWVHADQQSLEKALLEMTRLTDDERREMGLRGRRLIEERFAWPAIARQMLEVYRWSLGRGPQPPGAVTV